MIAPCMHSLVGTWLLLNISEIKNGVPTFPSAQWGTAPEGVIIYTASGWVSANIMATEAAWRPQTPRPHSAPELVLIANHTVAYTGPYAINASFVPPADDPGLGAVVHGPLTVVEDPVDVGTTFMRYFRLLEGGASSGCCWRWAGWGATLHGH
ncbi:uncharacterized protein PG998_014887 [Apiospora kogelbergensis]|uniref:uncharacterized protein n=1 Tax=Apiospora kogelbergensis TaxID=1337665 RepID=UPI00313277E0